MKYQIYMPVQFDEYEAHAEGIDRPIRAGSNAHRILSVLLEHPDTGFTPSEIAERTGMPHGSVGPTLQRLEARGLVRHKEPYWAAGTDDRLASEAGMLAIIEALDAAADDEGWGDVDATEYAVSDAELAAWRAEE